MKSKLDPDIFGPSSWLEKYYYWKEGVVLRFQYLKVRLGNWLTSNRYDHFRKVVTDIMYFSSDDVKALCLADDPCFDALPVVEQQKRMDEMEIRLQAFHNHFLYDK